MLLVKTFLGTSQVHGLGLFAAEDIKAGTVVSKLDRVFDYIITKSDVDNVLPVVAANYVRKHGFLDHGVYWISGDNDRFCNHSDTPNIGYSFESDEGVALIDIKAGEELTCDYYSFDEAADDKLKH
jgi:SET domain-containing protein